MMAGFLGDLGVRGEGSIRGLSWRIGGAFFLRMMGTTPPRDLGGIALIVSVGGMPLMVPMEGAGLKFGGFCTGGLWLWS